MYDDIRKYYPEPVEPLGGYYTLTNIRVPGDWEEPEEEMVFNKEQAWQYAAFLQGLKPRDTT